MSEKCLSQFSSLEKHIEISHGDMLVHLIAQELVGAIYCLS